jgi:uncharacterized SAM-binding protein YcdF (DUF218 family)
MLVLILGLMAWLALVWLHDDRGRRDRPRWWMCLWAVPLACLVAMAALVRSDLILQKLAGRLIMPAGLLWVAMGCAASAAWLRRRKRPALAWTLLLLGYTAVGSPLLAAAFMTHVESGMPAYDLDSGPAFDAVFVLGGGSERGPTRVELDAAGDRLILGALLYRRGKTPVLVTSGRSISGWGPARDLSDETATLWSQLGVPREAIIQVPEPVNTSQELAAYRRLVAEKGWTRLGIVSSAYHLPRALGLARRNGLEMTPIAADHRGGGLPPPALALVPYGPAFQQTNLAVWELVGRWVGR